MPNASPNNIWRLGGHRLIQGDARSAEDIARLMEGEKAALVLTDPPYGVGYVEGKREFLRGIHKGEAKERF